MNIDMVMAKIDKIRTLANRGGTQHEAEVAAAKMAELLLRYNLSMDDIDTHAEKTNRKVVCEDIRTTSAGWRVHLMTVVARGHGGRSLVVTGSGVCKVFAHTHNMIVIRSTYEWLSSLVERSANDAYKAHLAKMAGDWRFEFGAPKGYAIRWKNDYRSGFVSGVGHAYTEMKSRVRAESTGWGLIVAQDQEVDDEIAARVGKTQTLRRTSRSSAANHAGYMAGSSVNLGGQVGSSRGNAQIGG